MTDHEIEVLAKQLTRPNYFQISLMFVFILSLVVGVGYLTVVIPSNLQKSIENIVGTNGGN